MIPTLGSGAVVRSLICAVLCVVAGMQADSAQQANGLEAPWDVRTILQKLGQDNDDLKPLLNHLQPQQWANQKGASTVYILQSQTAQQQLSDVSAAARLLAQKTESLSLAFDLYFRLEALDVTARSLEEGVRKYGERQTADKIDALLARNFSNRERFRDYLRDLAASIEQNFKIADEEAQRCRGMISKEPPPAARKPRQ